MTKIETIANVKQFILEKIPSIDSLYESMKFEVNKTLIFETIDAININDIVHTMICLFPNNIVDLKLSTHQGLMYEVK